MKRGITQMLTARLLLPALLSLLAVPTGAAEPRASHTFQAIFLIAETTGSGTPAELPANAQKALRDAASFLPYKSYALLDTAWIRTSFKSSAWIAGPNGQRWELFLTVDVDAPSKDKLVVREFSVHSLTGEGLRTGGPFSRPASAS